MMRVRLPNGIISAAAMKYMGQLCATYGDDGCADITTRQNMQLRGIKLEDVPEIFKRLDAFGITTTQSGMDNVRNIVGSPIAGIDKDEIVDTREYCYLMNDYITDMGKGHKEITHLPRKFNVSIVGSHDLYEHPHINDIAYIPATKDGVFGFNVIFGGFFSATACKESIPLDVFVTPQQMVPICHATLTAFRDYGARQNRQKTRVMYLIEQMGLEGFRAELEKRVGCTLATEGESMVDPKWERRSYFGVNKQKDGDNFVGVCVPAGRLSPDDMLAVAHLAEAYGDGDIRLTVEQNLILSGVPDSNVDELLAQPILQKLHVNPGALSAGLVSCPGSQFCGFGQIETKANAIELTHKLEAALNIPPGVRIHWTGCPNSCGQAQVADIGLLGTTTKTAEGVVPAVEIFTGGRIGWDSHLADTYKSKVPVVDLVEELSELLIANHGATRK